MKNFLYVVIMICFSSCTASFYIMESSEKIKAFPSSFGTSKFTLLVEGLYIKNESERKDFNKIIKDNYNGSVKIIPFNAGGGLVKHVVSLNGNYWYCQNSVKRNEMILDKSYYRKVYSTQFETEKYPFILGYDYMEREYYKSQLNSDGGKSSYEVHKEYYQFYLFDRVNKVKYVNKVSVKFTKKFFLRKLKSICKFLEELRMKG